MSLLKLGISTSKPEVVRILPSGIWLFVRGKEYFLSYEEHPWFQGARPTDIRRVRLVHGRMLRWDALDVDLALDSLKHPERFPLKYR